MAPVTDTDAAIDALVESAGIRVWSLIVTIFGDLARQKGAWLSGADLSRITTRIGIRPEAMRVALHRLRQDDWIDSTRTGRTSRYALTGFGRDEAARAARRIYASTSDATKTWHLLIAEPAAQAARAARDDEMAQRGYVTLAPGSFLGKGWAPEMSGLFAIEGTVMPPPDWVRSMLMPERLAQEYAAFEHLLQRVEAGLRTDPALGEIDALALRILIVHNWRRLLLRHADLPDRFFPENCRIAACRGKVHTLLTRLPHHALATE